MKEKIETVGEPYARLLTIPQLAAAFTVKECTIQKWTREGKIPVIKISTRCTRYDLAAVKAALGIA